MVEKRAIEIPIHLLLTAKAPENKDKSQNCFSAQQDCNLSFRKFQLLDVKASVPKMLYKLPRAMRRQDQV
jgi:hypothetical protein